MPDKKQQSREMETWQEESKLDVERNLERKGEQDLKQRRLTSAQALFWAWSEEKSCRACVDRRIWEHL